MDFTPTETQEMIRGTAWPSPYGLRVVARSVAKARSTAAGSVTSQGYDQASPSSSASLDVNSVLRDSSATAYPAR